VHRPDDERDDRDGGVRALPKLLDVSISSGSGTVASIPTGIDCPIDCEQSFADSLAVTLTATPAAGFVVSTWDGACSGSGTPAP
jgi:hypothetical protein